MKGASGAWDGLKFWHQKVYAILHNPDQVAGGHGTVADLTPVKKPTPPTNPADVAEVAKFQADQKAWEDYKEKLSKFVGHSWINSIIGGSWGARMLTIKKELTGISRGTYWKEPYVSLESLLRAYLPDGLLPGFLEHEAYDEWVAAHGPLGDDEVLVPVVPLAAGGALTADNLARKDVFATHRAAAAAFSGKKAPVHYAGGPPFGLGGFGDRLDQLIDAARAVADPAGRAATLSKIGRGLIDGNDPRVDARAREVLLEAAAGGDADAAVGAAMLLLHGRGGPTDVDGSLKLLRQAAGAGHARAALVLGKITWSTTGSEAEGVRWLRAAAGAGETEATHILGLAAFRLAAGDPTSSERQVDLAHTHGKVGMALLAQGDTASALASCRAAVAIVEPMAAREPANALLQRALAAGHSNVGDALLAQGDAPAAIASFRAAAAIFEPLSRKDATNVRLQSQLGGCG